jgi:hypothetical protein
MKRLFVDTGAWYALVDKKDPDHSAAAAFFRNNKISLLNIWILKIRACFGFRVSDFGFRNQTR